MSGALEQGFLDDIAKNIDDDTPRLVYADWLSENGKDERGEFIRVQIERARLPAWDAAQVRLKLREGELLDKHGEKWLAELPTVEGGKWEGFRRGIVAEVSFANYEAMRKNAHACRAVAPVEAISVRWPRKREGKKASPPIAELRELNLTGMPDEEEVGWLADSPQLATLRVLNAHGLWTEVLEVLLESPHLSDLKVLRLPSNNFGNPGFATLAGCDSLSSLEELDLSSLSRHERYHYDPVIRAAGMNALMGWPGLARVRSLNLSNNDVSRDGLRALLRSPHAAALKHLAIRDARLTGAAMAEFATALPELRLESLDIGQNILKKAGVEHLASAACLRELKSLRIDRCEIPLTGARVLAEKGTFLDGLAVLAAGHNSFGPAGVEALLKRGPSLHALGLCNNDLFDKGVATLANSPATDSLLELDLSNNGLGAASARSLGESAHLLKLLVLHLGDNAINQQSTQTLLASPLGQRLRLLDLSEAPPEPEYDEDEFE